MGNICAKQNSSFGLAKFEIGGGSLLLFLLAVDVAGGDVNIVQ